MELLKTRLTSVLDELEEKNNRITSLHNELSVANDKHRRAISEVAYCSPVFSVSTEIVGT